MSRFILHRNCRRCGEDDWYVYKDQTKCRYCVLEKAKRWYDDRKHDAEFLEVRRKKMQLFRLHMERQKGF